MRLQGIARARWNGPFSLIRTRSRDRQPSIYNRPRDRQPWTLCCIYHRVKRFCLRVLHNQSSSFERHARLRQRGALFLAKCKYTRCPGSNHYSINRCTPERLGFSDFRPSMSPCRQSPTRDITEAGSREGKCTLCCDCRFNPIEKMSVWSVFRNNLWGFFRNSLKVFLLLIFKISSVYFFILTWLYYLQIKYLKCWTLETIVQRSSYL